MLLLGILKSKEFWAKIWGRNNFYTFIFFIHLNFRPSSKVKNFEVKELIFIIYLFQIAVVNDLDNCAKSVDKLKKYLVGHKNMIQENDSRASQKQLSETESIKTAIVDKIEDHQMLHPTNIYSMIKPGI